MSLSTQQQNIGKNVRVYLNVTKGVTFKSGSGKGKVVSFKGKLKEITKDSIILKGRYMWDGFINQGSFGIFRMRDKNFYVKFVEHKKIKISDIMRVMVVD